MSDLKVYWPESEPATQESSPAPLEATSDTSDGPEIYSFSEDVSRLPSGWSTAIDAQRWSPRWIRTNGAGICDARRFPLRAVQPRMATLETGDVHQP
jgi:hypothetical protein